jgi:glucokinase
MKRSVSIGVDIGGTNLKLGVISTDGRLMHSTTDNISKLKNSKSLIDKIRNDVQKFIHQHQHSVHIMGIGVGCPGYVDIDGLISGGIQNLPVLTGVNLKNELDCCGYPVYCGNDTNLAAFGEFHFNLKKSTKNIVFIALGTGIGGGLILNGELFTGGLGGAGEIGHICVEDDGFVCVCGNSGCVEMYHSTNGLNNLICREYQKGALSRSMSAVYENNNLFMLPEMLYIAVQNHDESAIGIHSMSCNYLAKAMGILVNILSPDAIVLGGGLMAASELILPELQKQIVHFGKPDLINKVTIKSSVFSSQAVLFGAAALVVEKLLSDRK